MRREGVDERLIPIIAVFRGRITMALLMTSSQLWSGPIAATSERGGNGCRVGLSGMKAFTPPDQGAGTSSVTNEVIRRRVARGAVGLSSVRLALSQ